MKVAARILLLISIPLIIYGYWGAFTQSGNKVYDEMDAYYPFFMMLLGVVLIFVVSIIALILRRKTKKKIY